MLGLVLYGQGFGVRGFGKAGGGQWSLGTEGCVNENPQDAESLFVWYEP